MADYDEIDYATLGTDIDVTPDLSEDENLRTDGECLIQDIMNGWTQPTGIADGTPEGAQWGIDLRAILSRGMTRASLFALKSSMETQAKRDDRVSDCVVKLTINTDTNRMTVDALVYVGQQPFPFSFMCGPNTVGDLWVERLQP